MAENFSNGPYTPDMRRVKLLPYFYNKSYLLSKGTGKAAAFRAEFRTGFIIFTPEGETTTKIVVLSRAICWIIFVYFLFCDFHSESHFSPTSSRTKTIKLFPGTAYSCIYTQYRIAIVLRGVSETKIRDISVAP